MSLTRFLRIPEVRQVFSSQIHKPPFTLRGKILAPPLTKNYSLVGTAFDYLMRFYLQRLNSKTITGTWVAEEATSLLNNPLISQLLGSSSQLRKKATNIIRQAKELYAKYITAGRMTDELVRHSIYLAQLDIIYRAGIIDSNLGKADRKDVDDLKNLISVVNPSVLKTKFLCVLNPTFGKASELVGGADADILLDDTLIDIKTVKRLELRRRDFNQLVGYYILFLLGGIDMALHVEIKKIGVYFSRYGILHTIPVKSFATDPKFPAFIEWFKNCAKEKYKRL